VVLDITPAPQPYGYAECAWLMADTVMQLGDDLQLAMSA
jgi:hypothetical protein